MCIQKEVCQPDTWRPGRSKLKSGLTHLNTPKKKKNHIFCPVFSRGHLRLGYILVAKIINVDQMLYYSDPHIAHHTQLLNSCFPGHQKPHWVSWLNHNDDMQFMLIYWTGVWGLLFRGLGLEMCKEYEHQKCMDKSFLTFLQADRQTALHASNHKGALFYSQDTFPLRGLSIILCWLRDAAVHFLCKSRQVRYRGNKCQLLQYLTLYLKISISAVNLWGATAMRS